MKVNNIMDAIGALFTIALVAVFLGKPNTAADVNAVGSQFTGALREAKA